MPTRSTLVTRLLHCTVCCLLSAVCTALTRVCGKFEFLFKAFLMSFATFLGGVKLILVKLASIKQMCNLILYSQCSGAEETRSDRAS